jgi:hypothetical protein
MPAMVGPLSDAEKRIAVLALQHVATDLAHLAMSLAIGTPDAAPEGFAEAMGLGDPLDGYEMMLQVPHIVEVLSAISPMLASQAIFDGSMPDEVRSEFFSGEFLVGEDGEIVYALAP